MILASQGALIFTALTQSGLLVRFGASIYCCTSAGSGGIPGILLDGLGASS